MNKRIITLALGLSFIAGMSAQGLHKEITVEQEIVPQKRDASRISVLPTISLPAIQPAKLNFSDRVITARVPGAITTLEPVSYGDQLYMSPYKGYVAGGIFPLFNADLSAGYRLVDSDKTRLSAWGQYNGDVYKETIEYSINGSPLQSKKLYNRDHTASLGLDLHQAIGENSFLDGGLDYTYGYHNSQSTWGHAMVPQSTNRINFGLSFNSKSQGLLYAVGANYQHFGFGDPSDYDLMGEFKYTPVKQNKIGASFDGLVPMGEESFIGLDADADFLMTSEHNIPLYPYMVDYLTEGSKTTGLVSLKPHYLYNSAHFTARIGAEVNLSIKDGKAFHISPDVLLAWTPTQIVGVEVKAQGGSQLNSLASLYDVTPYINGSFFYSQSHVPYTLDGKLAIGPFMGATLEFFGGYAKAKDWLMPVYMLDYGIEAGVFDAVDMSGWHFGAALGYEYRKIASARISFETAPNDDYDKGYYLWRDRAKSVINAELNVRPIKPLLVTLNWEFRSGRHEYCFDEVNGNMNMYAAELEPMGNMSILNLGAGYEYSDRLTFFVRGENLLNRKYLHVGERLAQGITGLIGASFKF